MKVAFASCSSIMSRYQAQQPVWSLIRKQQPALLLLLGDNVYIGEKGYDPEVISSVSPGLINPQPVPGEITVQEKRRIILESKYIAQLRESNFSKLINEVPFLAIWDNHDLGLPGHKYEGDLKEFGSLMPEGHWEMAYGLFKKYLQSKSLRPDEDKVYCSYPTPEEAGGTPDIKFIMVDARSAQENPDDPDNGDNAKLISDDQKDWLLKEMLESKAEINVICSGVPYSDGSRSWSAHKNWCHEFNSVAAKTSKPLFLGGNIHNNKFHNYMVTDFPLVRNKCTIKRLPWYIPKFFTRRYNTQNFFEVISSGVGQNFDGPKLPVREWEVPEEIGWESSEIAWGDPVGNNDKIHADLPRNNYGILDFTKENLYISLYGQRKDNMQYAVIDRNSWKLKEYWCMKKSNPE